MKKYLICVAISVLSLSSAFGSASEPSVSSGYGGVTLQSKLENFQRARAHLEAQILALMPQVQKELTDFYQLSSLSPACSEKIIQAGQRPENVTDKTCLKEWLQHLEAGKSLISKETPAIKRVKYLAQGLNNANINMIKLLLESPARE